MDPSRDVDYRRSQAERLWPDCSQKCPLKSYWKSRLINKDPYPENVIIPGSNRVTKETLHQTTAHLYKPLHPWQTRVLQLKHGEFTSPLVGEILVADVIAHEGIGISAWSEIHPFYALSYSWGWSSEMNGSIKCNGIDLPITQVLAEALQYLRLKDKDMLLWVDAICINQYNGVEKAQQVREMMTIFDKADTVLTWLGPAATADNQAWNFLSSDIAIEGDDVMKVMHDQECCEIIDQLRYAMQALLSRAWFSRAWVRQEVFAANNLQILYGLAKMDFATFSIRESKFYTLYELWQQSIGHRDSCVPLQSSSLTNNHLCLNDYARWRRERKRRSMPRVRAESDHPMLAAYEWALQTLVEYEDQHRQPAVEILAGSAKFAVTDERDRIYAITGMLEEYTNPTRQKSQSLGSLPIDYSYSISQVLQHIVKYIVVKTNNLAVLSIFKSRNNHDPNLPSWAFDVRQRNPMFCVFSSDFELPTVPPGMSLSQDMDDWGRFRISAHHIATVAESAPHPTKQILAWKCSTDGRPFDVADINNDPLPDPHERIIDECGYRVFDLHRVHWVGAQKHLLPEYFSKNERAEDNQRLALVASDCVQAGDYVVWPILNQVPFVLRSTPPSIVATSLESTEYLFLGPALLVGRKPWVSDFRHVHSYRVYLNSPVEYDEDNFSHHEQFVLI